MIVVSHYFRNSWELHIQKCINMKNEWEDISEICKLLYLHILIDFEYEEEKRV